MSSAFLPRSLATSSGRRCRSSAFIAALATLRWVGDPSDLARASLITGSLEDLADGATSDDPGTGGGRLDAGPARRRARR